MAKQKLDEREVRKARAVLERDGPTKAARRFGEQSPELQKAVQDRQAERNHAAAKQKTIHEEGTTMTQQDEKKTPAQQRAGKAQPTPAQERVIARQKLQAQRNARIKAKGQEQSQGQAM